MSDTDEIGRLFDEVVALRRARDPSTVDSIPRELADAIAAHQKQQAEMASLTKQAEEDAKHLATWRGHQRAARDYACAAYHQQHHDAIKRAETAERESSK